MSIDHYIVFVGATAPLATELSSITTRTKNARIVAPAVKKNQNGATKSAIDLALSCLFCELAKDEAPTQPARLSLWMYEPSSPEQFDKVWEAFGHAAWVETIPRALKHKVKPTREYVQRRINDIRPLLHEVSIAAFSCRKSSPLSLPLRNFSSAITVELKRFWYNELDQGQVSKKIKTFKARYSQARDREKGGFKDDKSLIFKPAKDTECHGLPHPLGSEHKSFACGRFRYGVALFPGFHYDVSAAKSATIQCVLRTSSGTIRAVRGEKRSYINIFPNDHLLPEK